MKTSSMTLPTPRLGRPLLLPPPPSPSAPSECSSRRSAYTADGSHHCQQLCRAQGPQRTRGVASWATTEIGTLSSAGPAPRADVGIFASQPAQTHSVPRQQQPTSRVRTASTQLPALRSASKAHGGHLATAEVGADGEQFTTQADLAALAAQPSEVQSSATAQQQQGKGLQDAVSIAPADDRTAAIRGEERQEQVEGDDEKEAGAEDEDEDGDEDEEKAAEEDEDDDDLEFVGFSEEELAAQDLLFAQDVLSAEDLQTEGTDHRCGYVAIIGKPNAGKSTLLNNLLGQKLSAVTRKAQTTRHRILGIESGDDYQMILLDTPGVIKEMRTKLDEKMMHNVRTAVKDADAVLVILDATEDAAAALSMVNLGPDWRGPPVALVLNKVDLLRAPEVERLQASLLDRSGADAVIPTCATQVLTMMLQGRGIEDVREWAVSQLPLGPRLYPQDVVAQQSERFFVAEILREKIFLQFAQEVPYCTAVQVVDFKERPGAKDYIQIVISVENESQRPILLGKKGSALKQLATSARIDIEDFLGRPVYLDITVKVMPKWRTSEKVLEEYGY